MIQSTKELCLALWLTLYRTAFSGNLQLTTQSGERQVRWLGGQPVQVSSNLETEALAHRWFKSEIIGRREQQAILDAIQTSGRK